MPEIVVVASAWVALDVIAILLLYLAQRARERVLRRARTVAGTSRGDLARPTL